MRKIFFIIAITFSINLCAQDDQRPTNQQMRAQMKQNLADVKKQRDDLSKQIAAAKANNEDAESVKKLEDQYAMLDKMIGMLQTADPFGDSKPKTSAASRTIEPAFISPFTPIRLKTPVATPSEAQAKDQLLWYKGKKIDANTLIATNGTVVRYTSTTHKLTIQPDKRKDTTYYAMVSALSNGSQRKKEYMMELDQDPNSFFMFPAIEAAYYQYAAMQHQYYDLAKNTLDLSSSRPLTNQELIINQIISYTKSLSLTPAVPALPKRPDAFCSCDLVQSWKNYVVDLENWSQELKKYEDELVDMILWLYRDREELIRRNGWSQDPPNFLEAVNAARVVIVKRLTEKLKSLGRRYENGEVEVEDALTYSISAVRTVLMYWETIEDFQLATEMYNAVRYCRYAETIIRNDKIFSDYINTQKSNRNYGVVLDEARYTRHEYNKELLSPGYTSKMGRWLDLKKKFNRFTFSIKLDFEYEVRDPEHPEKPKEIATGTLESDPIILSLGVEDCKVRLYRPDLNNADRSSSGEEFKIPLKVIKGQKDIIEPPLGTKFYEGPPKLQLLFPTFKLNFCGNKSEVMMNKVSYLASDLKAHEHDDLARTYSTDMMQYVNKMFYGAKKTQINAAEVVRNAVEGLNLAGSANMSQSTGDPVFDKLKSEYEGNKKRYQIQYQAGQATQTVQAVLDLGVINPQGSITIFRISPNLKDRTDEDFKYAGMVLREGPVSMELVHTPR